MRRKKSRFQLHPLVLVGIFFAICILITLLIVQVNENAANAIQNSPNYSTDSGISQAIKNLNVGEYSTSSTPTP
jgi:predicted PurR-regulated permease PerM